MELVHSRSVKKTPLPQHHDTGAGSSTAAAWHASMAPRPAAPPADQRALKMQWIGALTHAGLEHGRIQDYAQALASHGIGRDPRHPPSHEQLKSIGIPVAADRLAILSCLSHGSSDPGMPVGTHVPSWAMQGKRPAPPAPAVTPLPRPAARAVPPGAVPASVAPARTSTYLPSAGVRAPRPRVAGPPVCEEPGCPSLFAGVRCGRCDMRLCVEHQSTFSMRRWRDRDTLTRAYKTGYIYCKRCMAVHDQCMKVSSWAFWAFMIVMVMFLVAFALRNGMMSGPF